MRTMPRRPHIKPLAGRSVRDAPGIQPVEDRRAFLVARSRHVVAATLIVERQFVNFVSKGTGLRAGTNRVLPSAIDFSFLRNPWHDVR